MRAFCVFLALIVSMPGWAGRDDIAVIIGNRDYGSSAIPDVAFADRDAAAFRDYARQTLQIPDSRIHYELNATKARLEALFGSLSSHEGLVWSEARRGRSRIYVFYSGHGVPSGRDARGYLLPVDGDPDVVHINGYPVDLMEENLSKIRREFDLPGVTVYLDACFSGQTEGGALVRDASPVFGQVAVGLQAPDVAVISAAQAGQIASWDRTRGHGMFTAYLLEGLTGKADQEGYGNGDGQVSVAELQQWLDVEMSSAARQRYRRRQRASLPDDPNLVLATAPAQGWTPWTPAPLPGAPAAKAASSPAPKSAPARQTLASLPPADSVKAEADERILITAVQKELVRLGFRIGGVDGIMGPATASAIRNFERRIMDRRSTGKPSAKLLAALKAAGSGDLKLASASAGIRFQDCETCPEMVVVPAGSFTMGTDSGGFSEQPAHLVVFYQPFAVSRTEITFAQWDACVAAQGCHVWGRRKPAWASPDGPAVNISFNDATAYVRWLRKTTGGKYRLLSEAEWEYAARAKPEGRAVAGPGAAGPTAFHWGDAVGRNRAVCSDCGSQWDRRQPAPVASFAANAFGLYDMHGNVWEWVEDCWNPDHRGAPEDGHARLIGSCSRRVLKGGSWNLNASQMRSANRDKADTHHRFSSTGFRVAKDLN